MKLNVFRPQVNIVLSTLLPKPLRVRHFQSDEISLEDSSHSHRPAFYIPSFAAYITTVVMQLCKLLETIVYI